MELHTEEGSPARGGTPICVHRPFRPLEVPCIGEIPGDVTGKTGQNFGSFQGISPDKIAENP